MEQQGDPSQSDPRPDQPPPDHPDTADGGETEAPTATKDNNDNENDTSNNGGDEEVGEDVRGVVVYDLSSTNSFVSPA